jgi:hypothetical protein
MASSIASFHVEQQGLKMDNIRVEAFITEEDMVYKYGQKVPLLTTITFLEDNDTLLELITNINHEKYLYKEFEEQREVFLAFHKKGCHISFPGDTYHRTIVRKKSGDSTNTTKKLYVNLWEDETNSDEIPTSVKGIDIRKEDALRIHVSKKIIHFDFFEDVLYKNKVSSLDPFLSLIEEQDNKESSFVFYLDPSIDKLLQETELRNQYGSIIDDILNASGSRFSQHFTIPSFLPAFVCQWLINETAKVLNKKNHSVDVTNHPLLTGFIQQLVVAIGKEYRRYYSVPDAFEINFTNLKIVNRLIIEDDDKSLSQICIPLQSTYAFALESGWTKEIEQGSVFISREKMSSSLEQLCLIGEIEIKL